MNSTYWNREETAWAAGIYEGEGCISAENGTYKSPRMQVSMTDRDVVERFHRAVSGMGMVKPKTGLYPHHKPQWQWRSSKFEDVQAIIAAFWPWLGQRRRERAAEILQGHIEGCWRTVPGGICTTPGCETKARIRGLCGKHYGLARKNDALLPLRMADGRNFYCLKTCAEPGCGRGTHARGLCRDHYAYHAHRGTLPPPLKRGFHGNVRNERAKANPKEAYRVSHSPLRNCPDLIQRVRMAMELGNMNCSAAAKLYGLHFSTVCKWYKRGWR